MDTLGPRMERSTFELLAPEVVAALRAVSRALEAAGLDQSLSELVKLRASQINGCSFCLQYHLNLARQLGVPERKLDMLACWAESGVFSPRERAALAWTESLCRMPQGPVEDAGFEGLAAHFSPAEQAQLTAAIAVINAWNRIAGSLRFTPPSAGQRC